MNLCDICHEAHLRQRWTSKHELIGHVDGRNRLIKNEKLDSNLIIKCFIHPAQDLKLYCTSCDQVACHNCTILLHKGHKFESIEKASQYIIKSFQESFERNRKYSEFVNGSITKLDGSISKINAKADVVQVKHRIAFQSSFANALIFSSSAIVESN